MPSSISALVRRLERLPPSLGVAPPPPSREQISDFERVAGVKLPRDYVEFVGKCGAGLLCGYFRIFAPGRASLVSGDLAALHAETDLESYARCFDPPDLVRRMVLFGTTIGRDTLGWVPLSREPKSPWPVFCLLADDPAPLRLSESFTEFVSEVALGGKFPPLQSDPDWRAPLTFQRFSDSMPDPNALRRLVMGDDAPDESDSHSLPPAAPRKRKKRAVGTRKKKGGG